VCYLRPKRALFFSLPFKGFVLYFLITMGLFNFSKPSTDAALEIQLIVNDETVSVPADEAKGMTVSELFATFADGICDVTRINRYVSLGRIVPGTANAEAGTVYSGAITSEAKG
jgi:hypothetical protein